MVVYKFHGLEAVQKGSDYEQYKFDWEPEIVSRRAWIKDKFPCELVTLWMWYHTSSLLGQISAKLGCNHTINFGHDFVVLQL